MAVGSPALKAGVAVSVSGIDPALAGKWVISGSRHEFGAGAYRTSLEFTGRQDRSIQGLVEPGVRGAAERLPGVVIALVNDNDDPQDMGRVRLRFPWMGEDAESCWARVAMPGRRARTTASSGCPRWTTRCWSPSSTAIPRSRS